VSEIAARRIVQDILDRKIAVGTVLPPEKEMLAELGVGRPTLREALRLLEVQGIVKMKVGPGGGPVVQQPSGEALADNLALLLQFEGSTLEHILEAGRELWPIIAGLAAQRATAEDVAALQASVDAIRDEEEDWSAFQDHAWQFHTRLASATRNPVLATFIFSARSLADGSFMGLEYSREQCLEMADLLERIVVAVRRHTPEAARNAMRRYMEAVQELVTERFAHLLTQPVRWHA
jgi:DNA-binding FadR family transcriptional regulator